MLNTFNSSGLLESESPDETYTKERILPDGIIEMGLISIRFYPWGAYHFFSTPIKDFIDNIIDLADVYPRKSFPERVVFLVFVTI